MATIQTPLSLENLSAAPLDAALGPYTSLAAAKTAIVQGRRYDGLTVKIIGDSKEYFWEATDLTDTGLKAKIDSSTGTTQGTVRYVYLVADAFDQAAMGGAAKNVYITAQSAWDAALTIATANAAFQVVIYVGSITAAISGTLTTTLTAVTSRISWVGMGRAQSIIGNCTYTHTAATTLRMYNMTAGTQSFSTAGNFALTVTCETSTLGNTTFTYTGTAIATNPSLILQNCTNLTIGTVSASSTNAPTTTAGGLTLLFCNGCSLGAVTLVNYSISVSGGVTANIYNSIASVTTSGNSTVNITISIVNCVLGNVGSFYNTTNSITRNITFTNCSFAIFSVSGSGTMAGTNTVMFINCTFSSSLNASGGQIDNVSFRFRACTFNSGINGIINNMIFHNCFINQGVTAISVGSATITGVEFWLCSISSTGGTSWVSATTGTAAIKFTSSGSLANLPAGTGVTLT